MQPSEPQTDMSCRIVRCAVHTVLYCQVRCTKLYLAKVLDRSLELVLKGQGRASPNESPH